MSTDTPTHLNDDDIETVLPGMEPPVATLPEPKDADGTDADGTDGDSTEGDSTDGDSTDSDGTDSGDDADSTDL